MRGALAQRIGREVCSRMQHSTAQQALDSRTLGVLAGLVGSCCQASSTVLNTQESFVASLCLLPSSTYLQVPENKR